MKILTRGSFFKTLIFYSVVLLFFGSCSHKISRVGYSEPEADLVICEVIFKKFASTPSKGVKKIGDIELKDSGFSTRCDELDAIQLMKNEACLLGANYVNVISEKRADFKSTCYRCVAEIFVIEDDSLLKELQSSQEFEFTAIEERIAKDKEVNRKNTRNGIISGVLGGLLAGLIVGLLF